MPEYPPEAYAPDGDQELWWLRLKYPGGRRRFGAEKRLAAYLAFHVGVGGVVTLRQLRDEIPQDDGEANEAEHFNRRFRALRGYKWVIASQRDDASLGHNEYRVKKMGDPIWLGKAEHKRATISAKTRREVLDRDGHRCVVCGVGAGEPYPGDPDSAARMTIGHFKADQLKGKPTIDNLRVECSRCNEPVGNQVSSAETVEDIWPRIVKLSRPDKTRLVEWLSSGMRTRSEVERIYDLIRTLPAGQRDEVLRRLRDAV